MVDLALTLFVFAVLALGMRKPFLWVLAYLYVDILAPQKIGWLILAKIPISFIAFVAAFGGWLIADAKTGSRFTFRQWLILALLLYCGFTTLRADYPVEALHKWDWVWKALLFGLFLPLTLRTRLRIEAAALVMALSAGAIIISAGLKTATGGGGYGMLRFFVGDNTGLYEGSTLSTVAIAIIPLIVWLARHGTIFPRSRAVYLFAGALIFACLLIPIGTQTRTGLLCIGLLCVLTLRTAKRRFLYLGLMAAAAVIAIPFLPQSFTSRMSTIENHQSDESASTRVAVWAWTWEYAKDHPLGGGFDSYRGNKIAYNTKSADATGNTTAIETKAVVDEGRAFHSAYFEMLGEQGYPGLLMWLLLQGLGLIQLEVVRMRLRKSEAPLDASDRMLAMALQQGHIVCLFGALFVGIAYQPFFYMLIALQIALVEQVRRRRQPAPRPMRPAPRTLRPLAQVDPS